MTAGGRSHVVDEAGDEPILSSGDPVLGGAGSAAAAATSDEGLTRRAARGGVVTVGGQVLKIVVQVLAVVLLARQLSPADYGLVAMVLAVIGVADIFRDFGLSSAAVQVKHLSTDQRSNLFWVNVGIGVALAVLVFAGAPLLALVYQRAELTEVARVLSVAFLLNGVATQYRADLNRRMRFAELAFADLLAPAVGLAAALVAVHLGAGYWAIVTQQLVTIAVMLIVVLGCGRWMPGRPRRDVAMDGMLRFGSNLAGSQVLGYLGKNVDSLTIGVRFGATPLGIYNRGFQLLMTPLGQLRAPTTTVALPVLSSLRADEVRYSAYLRRGQLVMGYTLVAGLGLVIGGAQPLAAVLLGPQWLSVTPILRLLALAGMFQTLAYVGYWVYLSRGLTRQLLLYTIVTTVMVTVCILVGSTWGVVGVAAGYAVSAAVEWPLSFWWLSSRSAIPVRDLVHGALRIVAFTLLVAGFAAAGDLLTASLGEGVRFAVVVVAGVGGYVVLATAVPVFRRDVSGVLRLVRRGVRR